MAASAIDALIHQLSRLPSIGQRSARRMALALLRNKESSIPPLVTALNNALTHIQTCNVCGNLDDNSPCRICADSSRDPHIICVVEDVADVWAIERSHVFRGRYHVLGGTLSAMDGRTPAALKIDSLITRAGDEDVLEIILATNATVAGQTTAHYLTERLSECNVKISRLAQGIPMGGELDYLDDGTLLAALKARAPM
jgi:recombination protein RecR